MNEKNVILQEQVQSITQLVKTVAEEANKFLEEGNRFLALAKTYEIRSEDDLKAIEPTIKEMRAVHDNIAKTSLVSCIDLAHKLHRTLCAIRAQIEEPFDFAVALLKQKVLAWRDAERKRREAEEAERVAKERKALEEAAKKMAKKAPELAKELETRAECAAPTPVKITTPFKTRKIWVASVTDEDKFFAALAKNKQLRGFVEVRIAALARAKTANNMLEVEGVTFEQREV